LRDAYQHYHIKDKRRLYRIAVLKKARIPYFSAENAVFAGFVLAIDGFIVVFTDFASFFVKKAWKQAQK